MPIGELLHQARLESGLTLNEISARTRINESLLAAMEAGELHKLPAGAIGRSFVKQYARIVGVPAGDLEKELADFDPATTQALRQAPRAFKPKVPSMKEGPRAYGSLVASLLWVFAAILFCSGTYWLLTRGHVAGSARAPAPARQK